MLRYLGGVLIEAGSDTTAAFLQSFILLLVAHPEVQAKAQREIDEVVGAERMPTLDDFAKLPYLRAVVSEVRSLGWIILEAFANIAAQTHRFRPVAPLTVPHAATADIRVSAIADHALVCRPSYNVPPKYGQYVIPKGSIVFANACECYYTVS